MDSHPSVLLTERDPILSLDLSGALEMGGYRVLGPAATAVEALRLLEQELPSVAVLDVQSKDGPFIELVHELYRRGVPILVHADQHQGEELVADLPGTTWIGRPALAWDAVILVDEMSLSARRSGSDAPSPGRPAPLRLAGPAESTRNPFVRKLEGFASLSDADRAMLERISAEARIVAPRTDLIREGDRPDGVFLVMKGMAGRYRLRADGTRQITAYLVSGDLCDLDVALLDAMDHSITTLSACKVVRIAPETVADIMAHYPTVARALRLTTLVDEATLREWLVNVGCRDARERVAHIFCELLVRLQAVGQATANSYAWPLTQVDLADTAGMSSVHVNRTLQDLRRQGLIALRNGRLTILNLPALKTLAEFKPGYLHIGRRAAA